MWARQAKQPNSHGPNIRVLKSKAPCLRAILGARLEARGVGRERESAQRAISTCSSHDGVFLANACCVEVELADEEAHEVTRQGCTLCCRALFTSEC